MTNGNKSESKKERKKKARRTVILLLRRVERICGHIQDVDNFLGQFGDIVEEIKELVSNSEFSAVLEESARQRLLTAIEYFETASDKIGLAADICGNVTDALEFAETILRPTFLEKIPGGLATVMGAATLAAAAAILPFVLQGDDEPPPIVLPSISFRAEPSTIFTYQEPRCTTLIWEIEDANVARLEGRSVRLIDSTVECPGETRSYLLEVENGVLETRSQTVTVVDDTDEPVVAVRFSPPQPTTRDLVRIDVTARDSESGIEIIEVYANNSLRATCVESFCSVAISPTTEGSINIEARAIDRRGNEASDFAQFFVSRFSDTTPVSRIINPQNMTIGVEGRDSQTGLGFASIVLQGAATDREDGRLPDNLLTWTTNRSDLQPSVLGTGANLDALLFSNWCAGGATHEITLTARDNDGNSSSSKMTVTMQQIC